MRRLLFHLSSLDALCLRGGTCCDLQEDVRQPQLFKLQQFQLHILHRLQSEAWVPWRQLACPSGAGGDKSLRLGGGGVETPSFLQFLATVHDAGIKAQRGNRPRRLQSIQDNSHDCALLFLTHLLCGFFQLQAQSTSQRLLESYSRWCAAAL